MASAINIFVCYAYEDERLWKRLEKQLNALQRQTLINIWHSRNISAGMDWKHEVNKHLNEAHVILLLVSPDFISSDYCYSIEMKRALERYEAGEAYVIPVILRAVYWGKAPFGKLQALPTDGKPITSRTWRDLNEAFFNVAEGIRAVVDKLTENPSDASIISFSRTLPYLPKIGYGDHKYLRDQFIKKIRAVTQLEKSARILVVDDNPTIVELLKYAITLAANYNLQVTVAYDGMQALEGLHDNLFDVIILDYNMPRLDGLEFIRRLHRRNINIPIIMVTTHSEVRAEAFKLGVVDFFNKPFHPIYLALSLEAIIQTKSFGSKEHSAENMYLEFAGFSLNTTTCELICGNRVIELSATEYKLLHLFMSNPRKVVDRTAILREVWGNDFHGDTAIIEVYIKLLREKIEDELHLSRMIHTVSGIGYVLKD